MGNSPSYYFHFDPLAMFLKLESARKNEKDEESIPLTSNRSTIHSGREQFPPPAGRNLHTPPLIVKTPDEDYRKQFNSTSGTILFQVKVLGCDISKILRLTIRPDGVKENSFFLVGNMY